MEAEDYFCPMEKLKLFSLLVFFALLQWKCQSSNDVAFKVWNERIFFTKDLKKVATLTDPYSRSIDSVLNGFKSETNLTTGEKYIDLDDDGMMDLSFEIRALDPFVFGSPRPDSAGPTAIFVYSLNAKVIDMMGYAQRFDEGDDMDEFNYALPRSILGTISPGSGFTGNTGYFGFRMEKQVNDGDFLYGWVKVALNADNSELTILETGINTIANYKVKAGEK